MAQSFRDKVRSIRYKIDATAIAQMVINHQYEIDDLMACFFSKDWVLCQKASWPVAVLADKRPELLHPFLPKMIENLDHPSHDAVVRNIVRAWSFLDIPEEVQGEVYDKCFEFLADPKAAIAIRVFSMTVCANIAIQHPALAEEIIPIIEDHYDHGTAGFRSRARKELKRLNKLISA